MQFALVQQFLSNGQDIPAVKSVLMPLVHLSAADRALLRSMHGARADDDDDDGDNGDMYEDLQDLRRRMQAAAAAIIEAEADDGDNNGGDGDDDIRDNDDDICDDDDDIRAGAGAVKEVDDIANRRVPGRREYLDTARVELAPNETVALLCQIFYPSRM